MTFFRLYISQTGIMLLYNNIPQGTRRFWGIPWGGGGLFLLSTIHFSTYPIDDGGDLP